MIKAFVIIPAKGDSKRLIGKNKRIIAGKTLLEHSIEYAQLSKYATTIIVSTEDKETKKIAEPDHPDRTIPLDKMLEYAVENKYDDLFTVDPDGTRNGSIRIAKAKHVKVGTMSRRVGSMMDDCTNIHSEQDLLNAEKNIIKNG